MAKKLKLVEGELPDIFDTIKSIDETAEIIADSAYSNILDWIPTGNYLLNACISGDLFRGIPSGRVSTLVGESGAGKSYLSASICREAQKKDYTPIYMDSEGAVDSEFVKRLGVDPNKMIIKQVNTIGETSKFIANLCKQLQDQEDKYGKHQKVILVLDSLGNLTSDKEREDTLSGNQKRDMTKQQEIKAMFRVNATPIAKLQIPWIVVSHVYSSMSMFNPGNVVSGGSGIQYNSSVTLELFKAKLTDKENDDAAAKRVGTDTTKNGVLVTAKPQKSRFCIPQKIKFQIPFFKKPNPYIGLESYMTWDNAGVCRGNIIDKKTYDKLSPAEQQHIHVFEYEGQEMYCQEKDTARGIVVKHLGRQVSFIEFFSDTVFTDEYLHYLNDNVIRPAFQLPNQDAFDDIKEIEETLNNSEDPINELNIE